MKKKAAKPELRILICVPVLGDVKSGSSFSMTQAALFFAQAKSDVAKYIDIQMVKSSNLVENRHILVSRALAFGATHMLFWDADIKAPADCIIRLVNHHLPIVAVNYAKKEPEARPTAYLDTDTYTGPCWTQKQHTGLQAVTSCGFGLMLIETQVFEKLSPPFFEMKQFGQHGLKTETEDVYFCHKAIDAGFDVVIDHDLSKEVAHLGDWEYMCSHSDIAREAKQTLYRAMPTSGPDVAH
jgi:hypothetical protein